MSFSIIKHSGYGGSYFFSACGDLLGGMGGELSLDRIDVSSSSSYVIMGEVVLLIFLPEHN